MYHEQCALNHDATESALIVSLITRLRLRTADPCTKSEVSSVSRCGDITWGVKFLNRLFDPDHDPFREDFSSAGWDVLW